uniref:Uncharacterized protein n=1 Tax=Chrysaora quinquecirrha TaxID=6148 RepID=G8DM02_CHRQI|nr:hypothetical protein [Chrysaora quinquecirrha]ADY15488.1 hypothetical protein [Chrysaora quinquecirrha]
MLIAYKRIILAQQLYNTIKKARITKNQYLLSFTIYKHPSNKEINNIIKSISNKIKEKPFLQIFIQANKKYYTLQPLTPIDLKKDNLKSLVTNLLKNKLSIFNNQYNFSTNTIILYYRLTK